MAQERLDKLLASTGLFSRREVKDLVRQGRVLVDGVPARSAEEKADPLTAEKYVRRREKVGAIDEECTVQK